MEQSLKRNSCIYMIRNVINILFPLITFKYASLKLGATGIGATNVASAYVSYFSLISQLGINAYAVAEGAKIRYDNDKLQRFSNEIFTINIISTVIAYVLLITALLISPVLDQYKNLMVIYSASIILSTIGVEWIFVIYEKFSYITIRSIIFQVVSLIFLFLFVKSEKDSGIYALLSVLSSSGSGVLNFIYAHKIVAFRFASIHDIRRHLKSIFTIWIANVASLIYVNADTIIIGFLLGDTQVGIYSAVAKIVKAICIPIGTISTVAGPHLAECIAIGNRRSISEFSNRVLNFLFFLIFPCMIGLLTLGNEAILLVSGSDFLEGITALYILVIDILVSPMNGFLTNQILIPAHKEKTSMRAMVIAAIANILLDFLLIPHIGINGAAIATVVAETIVLLFCFNQTIGIVDWKVACAGCVKYILCSLIIIPIAQIINLFGFKWAFKTVLTVLCGGGSYLSALIILKKINVGDKDE